MDCVGMDIVRFLKPREDQSILLSEKNRLPNNIYSMLSLLEGKIFIYGNLHTYIYM